MNETAKYFSVLVASVDTVEEHPNADRLNVNSVLGYNVVSNKNEDGSARYTPGQLVVYVPVGSFVPDYLLKDGFWDEKNNKGGLGGATGNIVEARTIRKVLSEGLIFPVETSSGIDFVYDEKGMKHVAFLGQDVADILGIKAGE